MYPAPIDAYFAPRTIDEALTCLAEAGDGAMFIAGGMSLMQAMKARLVTPRALVDLNKVEELSGLAKGPRGVTVRPLTRYREPDFDGWAGFWPISRRKFAAKTMT